jgi:hypothetical protein
MLKSKHTGGEYRAMIEFVVLACLLSEPQRCERYFVPTAAPMSMMECVVAGQVQLVQWHQEHPDWVIRRWTCGLPRA